MDQNVIPVYLMAAQIDRFTVDGLTRASCYAVSGPSAWSTQKTGRIENLAAQTSLLAKHPGNPEHPQNCEPAFAPQTA